MKRFLTVFLVAVLVVSFSLTAVAEGGSVTYNGQSKNFVFAPGSQYSLTDLFPNFKDVMPGDSITQEITVRNTQNVKVKIYMRSLGAQNGSQEFLSQLNLKVQKSQDNLMPYMFDAAADQTADLTNWDCLGTLYSGGEVNLNVILNVPTTLKNDYKDLIGYIDWQFMVEELPTEPGDPQAPQTNDNSLIGLWLALIVGSATLTITTLILKHKRKII